MKGRKLFIVGLFLVLFTSVNAQKKEKTPVLFGKQIDLESIEASGGIIKCGSYEYEQYQRTKNPNLGTTEQFEQWLAPRIEKYKQKAINTSNMSVNNVITIPVVVHILHNNKGYGIQENITDEQVFSQIEVLNQDYRRQTETPGFNNNSVGSDIEVQFCLAVRTPDGDETNGINRINLAPPSGGYTVNNIDSIKPATQWNPEQYLNIWVVNEIMFTFFGIPLGEVLGIAQFPIASGLNGLDNTGTPTGADTDGVVVGHRHFGSYAIYPQGTYASNDTRGRTATHEVGHYLGLRHIWGDSNSCSVDDFCADTPNATSSLEDCISRSTCGVEEMKENYMNYTPDTCQNIFTQDQKTRIRTVLENSPRRNTLATSLGCVPLQVYGFDGRVNIVNLGSVCDTNVSPVVLLRNVGDTTEITSAVLSYGISGNMQTYNWSGSLGAGQSQELILPNISFNGGSNLFTVTLVSLNGTSDDNTANDTTTRTEFKVNNYASTVVTLNLTTDNYGDETSWELLDSNGVLVYEGNNYEDNVTITETFNLIDGQCYTFTINDSALDGICCNYGQGSYTLSAGDEVIFTGGDFGGNENTRFRIGSASVDNNVILDGISLYPNPTKGLLNIASKGILPNDYVIYNTIGQVVKKQKIADISDLSIDTSSFSNGVYLIKVTKEGKSKTLRFVKQ